MQFAQAGLIFLEGKIGFREKYGIFEMMNKDGLILS